MRILDLALKDLHQIVRDKRAALFLIVMPIGFTFFMGFAYGSGEGAAATDRLALGWVNHDPGGPRSERLFDLLGNSDSLDVVELAPESAPDAVRGGDVAGALIVPAGFSEAAAGELRQLQLLADPTSTNGQTLFQMLRGPVTQLMSAVEIARLSTELVGRPGDMAEWGAAFAAADRAWAEADSAAWVKLEAAVAPEPAAWYGDNPFNQASPGILVQFAIFGLVTSGQILVQERKNRTLHRLLTTSMRPWEMVAGHLLAMFALVLAQTALLIVFGQLALGVDYARQPLATLVVSVGLGLWVAALGLLIGVLVRDDSQVVLFSLIAMFIFSALGGTWFPLEVAGGAFAAIGRWTPSAWAMTGYQNIVLRGLGPEAAWQPALILLAYAAGLFALAVWRFRRMPL